ncbi:MAG TPA: hypothetical protein C5S37_13085 [Methanophagales archaeon]|nr:hypothetical protein [Methanophagales archaeon]
MMRKKGDLREHGWGLKIVTVLAGLLFLLVMVAMAAALPLDSGSSRYAVANPPLMGEWERKANTSETGALGEAVVGTGDDIYIAWCRYYNTQPEFWRYEPSEDKWNYSMSTSGLPTGAFRNGAALAWDNEDYIYALLGARYKAEDDNRSLFYRYSITNDSWGRLADTPHAQGAGDAITWSDYDGYIYAIAGNKDRKSVIACYNVSNNSWNELPFNPNWTSTDDGAALVWTGGEYLYALQGEVEEEQPNFNFSRYDILTGRWEDMAPLKREKEGVGDGASLLWIGNWLSKYNDYIFALGGGSCLEDPGYNFYNYSISSNGWEPSEPIPCPIGWYVGNRLGFAKGHIYYWQGTPKNESKWICNGTAFFMFELEPSPPSIFDTCPGTYPSIFGAHNGTITPNQTINVSKLYTYPCVGTGGHTEYARIWNSTLDEIASWDCYKGDWHNISFNEPFTLVANETYNYTLKTGSYPQIHHTPALPTANGWINCTEFRDANGKIYYDWIPAIKLYFFLDKPLPKRNAVYLLVLVFDR